MNEGRTIFSQLMDSLPRAEFRQCVERYQGNRRIRTFTCLDQFLCMAFAQLTGRESLRDIETCLRMMGAKLYHAGIRGTVSRNTLAKANENRSSRIYADFAQVLIRIARELYAEEPFAVELEQTAYALDSTTIELCLALFPWAKFRQRKGAVKLHTLLDLRGNLPTAVIVTTGKVHDVNILDELGFEPGAIYIMDRGYLDFARLWRIDQAKAFFITRAKRNFDGRRLYSRPVDRQTGLRSDHTVALNGVKTRENYPANLRRVRYCDAKTGKRFVFLTNNFRLPALTIARLYKCRWQVELFFKWIKQHLRIKSFFGTTENAVKTQIWIAISVYVLVAIVKKRLHLESSLYTILQILSLSLFEKMPILQALAQPDYRFQEDTSCEQLDLFDF
jgi:hypothetical protein